MLLLALLALRFGHVRKCSSRSHIHLQQCNTLDRCDYSCLFNIKHKVADHPPGIPQHLRVSDSLQTSICHQAGVQLASLGARNSRAPCENLFATSLTVAQACASADQNRQSQSEYSAHLRVLCLLVLQKVRMGLVASVTKLTTRAAKPGGRTVSGSTSPRTPARSDAFTGLRRQGA